MLLGLLILSIYAAAEQLIMTSIPVVRTSWEARTNIQSSFGSITEGSGTNLVVANFDFNTTRPTIRLDNYVEIVKIGCETYNEIDIQFDKETNAKEAYREWSNTPNLAFLTGHEHKCNFDLVGSFFVSHMHLEDDSIVATVQAVPREAIVSDWEVAITQSPVHHSSDLVKRDYGRNFTIPLDWSLDSEMKKIGDPYFWFLGCQFVFCSECWTKGQAQMQVEFKGHGLTVNQYKLRVKGDFIANLNLKLLAVPQNETYLYWDYIAVFPLTAFAIPGIFTLGPQLRIMAAFVTYADTELSAVFGFNVDMPFDIEIASKNLTDPPSTRNHQKTKFTYHPLKLIVFEPRPTYIGGHLMLAPEIAIGLILHHTPILDIAVRVQNQIGFVHRYGNLTKCKGETPHTEIFHRHKFQHTLSPTPFITLIYTHYDTDMLPITCLECNSCPADAVFGVGKNKTGNHASIGNGHINDNVNANNTMSEHDIKFLNATSKFDKVSNAAVFK